MKSLITVIAIVAVFNGFSQQTAPTITSKFETNQYQYPICGYGDWCGTEDYPMKCGFGFGLGLGIDLFDPTVTLTNLNTHSLVLSSMFMIADWNSPVPYYIGLTTGIAQAGYGVHQFIRSGNQYGGGCYDIAYYPQIDQRMRRKSYVNMGVGAISTLVNAFGLGRYYFKRQNRAIQLGLYTPPTADGGTAIGLSFVKQF